MERGLAGHHGDRQRHRRRFSDGRMLGDRRGCEGHDGRLAWDDVRRQPACHGGGERRARHRPRARVSAACGADGAAAETEIGRNEGSAPGHRCRNPRSRTDGGPAHAYSEYGFGRGGAAAEAPYDCCGRQCGAAPATADRGRGRRCGSNYQVGRRLRGPGGSDQGRGAGSRRMSAAPLRHFLDLSAYSGEELRRILHASAAFKAQRRKGKPPRERPLAGKMLAMVFDKPSTRTRVSFDVAMRELGGETIMLTGQEMQLGRGETIADTARVLSRYVDIIMIRTLEHDTLTELARYATVPVINGLTRRSHPCQVLADVLTFEEHRGPIRGKTVAWTGDANNVLASWMQAAERFEFRLKVATPPELAPKKWLTDWIKHSGAPIEVGTAPDEAAAGSDCIVTDTWVSMGDKDGQRRHNLLSRYQVSARLMARAKPDAVFMHCLPAHRGDEVTDEVIDGPQSVVFDEAENRLHAQKGILAWCLNAH